MAHSSLRLNSTFSVHCSLHVFRLFQSLHLNASQMSNQITLDRVLGFTLTSNCALALDCNSGTVAYVAGWVRHVVSLFYSPSRPIEAIMCAYVCVCACVHPQCNAACAHPTRTWDIFEFARAIDLPLLIIVVMIHPVYCIQLKAFACRFSIFSDRSNQPFWIWDGISVALTALVNHR